MRFRNTLAVGVITLICALFVSCAANPAPLPTQTTPLPIEEAKAVVTQLVPWPLKIIERDKQLYVVAYEHQDNPRNAELSRVTGWDTHLLVLTQGAKDPDPQHRLATYDKPVTADGMVFATVPHAETGIGNPGITTGTVRNVNGCLTIDRRDVPIFGTWKSVAPTLRDGDEITLDIYGGLLGVPWSDGLTMPDECRGHGFDLYYFVSAVLSVN